MAVTTNVPSDNFDDWRRDGQDLTKFVNQNSGSVTTRTGGNLTPLPVRDQQFQDAIASIGYDQVGTFAAGFEFTSPNQVGQDADGNWWRWNGTLPKVVTAGTLPSSDANYKLVGDGVLRSDLADGSAYVGGFEAREISANLLSVTQIKTRSLKADSFVNCNFYSTALLPSRSAWYVTTTVDAGKAGANPEFIGDDFVAWDADGKKLVLIPQQENELSSFGLISGQSAETQTTIINGALRVCQGRTVTHNNAFEITTNAVNVYPNTKIKGGGFTRSRWQMADTALGSKIFNPVKPSGYGPEMHQDVEIKGFTFIGNTISGEYRNVAIDLANCVYWSITNCEFAVFKHAISFGRTFSPPPIHQSFHHTISLCEFAACANAYEFGGAANRNEFRTNTYKNCLNVYDFSPVNNVSETNVFINENVEGCRNWAEWRADGGIFSQTWLGLTIENPTSNGFVCTVKDPGRQLFSGLALIPANNPAAVDFFTIAGRTPSLLLGSRGSSEGFSYGLRLSEPTQLMSQTSLMGSFTSGTAAISATLAQGVSTSFAIPVVGAEVGDFCLFSITPARNNVLMSASVDAVGQVNFVVQNQTGETITLSNTVRVAVLKNGF